MNAMADKTEYSYLRHHPPSGTCVTGTTEVIGEMKADVHTVWNEVTGRLVSSDCSGQCVAAAGEVVALGPCNANNTVWSKVVV